MNDRLRKLPNGIPVVPLDKDGIPVVGQIDAGGGIEKEVDPIWNAEKINYYTKTQLDIFLAKINSDIEKRALSEDLINYALKSTVYNKEEVDLSQQAQDDKIVKLEEASLKQKAVATASFKEAQSATDTGTVLDLENFVSNSDVFAVYSSIINNADVSDINNQIIVSGVICLQATAEYERFSTTLKMIYRDERVNLTLENMKKDDYVNIPFTFALPGDTKDIGFTLLTTSSEVAVSSVKSYVVVTKTKQT